MIAILFIFVPMSPHTPRHIPVDYPTAIHPIPIPGADREDAIQIALTRDGRVFFGNHQVVPEDLAGEIRERVRSGAEKRIYLAADEVKMVLEEIRLAGVENVGFLTQEPRR